MALLVKKFGGTSVGDIKKIKNIASSICQSKEAGNEIVVVVSAMGKTTDDLNCLAESISKNPNQRELDMPARLQIFSALSLPELTASFIMV